jgi:integrase
MAILAECPRCHEKQAAVNRLCKCGADLVKLKKAGKVKYWIKYRDAQKIQRKEPVGYSIEEARAVEGKVKAQKHENPRGLKKVPEEKMTFRELSEWYLGLEKIKSQAYFPTLKINLASFNSVLGTKIISHIKPVDLENYQAKRKAAGYSDSYVDQETGAAKAVINKAFDNDLVSGETVKVFKRVKKLLKRNANARDKILTLDQFDSLMENLPRHTKAILSTAFYTGMRRGEILSLTWDKVDMESRFIRLEAADTKDKEPRSVPICDELFEILRTVPRALHDEHVFLYKGQPINDIRTGLKEACKTVGIPYGRFVKGGFVFHDLRHTFNTYMRKAGVPESVIMEITGHSTREMFDRYNTIDHEDKTQAVRQLQGFLKGNVEDPDEEDAGVEFRGP